jgi:hypothetical protein
MPFANAKRISVSALSSKMNRRFCLQLGDADQTRFSYLKRAYLFAHRLFGAQIETRPKQEKIRKFKSFS